MSGSFDNEQSNTDETQIVAAKKMRPGGIGRTVFYILFGSMALVIIAWIALEIWAYNVPANP